MALFLIRRTVSALITLFGILTATFFLLRTVPGGPFDTERALPVEIQANIEERYGLSQPLSVQYFQWLSGIATGDFHESFHYLGKPVLELIMETLPVSLFLGFSALILSIFVGIGLGSLGAYTKGSWIDFISMGISVAGVSLPSYLTASVLIFLFALILQWFPAALLEDPSAYVLPVLALAVRPIAMVASLTRSTLIEALSSDYIRTARAKGLRESQVVFKHALKCSLGPVASLIGPVAANLITGSFVIELVFQLPGMGKHFVSAVMNRDYPLVMGVTFFYGVILLISNVAADAAHSWVDPRIRSLES